MCSLAIIIPAYKATFLRSSLESIAAQTDNRFTLYIGDDASPNNLYEIIKDFKDKINIRYHKFESNLGKKNLTAHWERCINLTQGEPFIWLFSDDDVMEKNCVAEFYKTLRCYGNEGLFHFDIDMISHNDKIKTPLPSFPTFISAGQFLDMKVRGKLISFVVEFIFSRKLYKEVNGFEVFDLAWGSDFITWLKMTICSPKGIITIEGADCKVAWRASDENITPNNSREILLRKLRALIENAAFIKGFMKAHPKEFLPYYFSFRYVKFPLGEIKRNLKFLKVRDVISLLFYYFCKVL